jgi:hypothetical protein
MTERVSASQFVLFRKAFGLYLLFHFLYVLPFAKEIFSSEGMLPKASLNPGYGYFPSVLNYWDSPAAVWMLFAVLILSSLCLALGLKRNVAAVILWYGWACLYNRNILIQTPSLFYVGWLLLVIAVIPTGESKPGWKFPPMIYWMAWWLLAFGYSLSGFDKFMNAPSWSSGEALNLVLQTPFAGQGFFKNLFMNSPFEIQRVMTWTVLAVEALFLPLSIVTHTRQWIWLAMVFVHVGILTSLGFPELTIEMLFVHWFVYDRNWKWPGMRHLGGFHIFSKHRATNS